MGHKRPFSDLESHETACKHSRQLECSNQLNFVEIAPCNDAFQKPHGSGDDDFIKSQVDERLGSEIITDLPNGADREFETGAPDSISSLSWVTSSTSEEDARSELAVHGTFSPGYFEPNHPIRALAQAEDIYLSRFDYPPRKLVSIGPDHQADVPVWGLDSTENGTGLDSTENGTRNIDASDPKGLFSQSSGLDAIADADYGNRFMGNCVVPMLDSEPSAFNGDKVGDGRTDCSCLDCGSIRCVRQHVVEAREKLKGTLGQERFVELGFCDMGEVVALKWNEEEEQLFHEVVFSNPASLGKNFWNCLLMAFHSRTKKELVSYYFNVFMLRRRAEQNRSDPLNIDSDNDEWQGSDDDGDELGMTEEDEDSVVESPVDRDDPGYNQDHEEEFHDDDDGDEISDNNEDNKSMAGEEDEGGVDDVSNMDIGKSLGGSAFKPTTQLQTKIPQYDGEDHDVQDDSCTSYECQHNGTDSCGPVDMGEEAKQDNRVDSGSVKRLQGDYNGLSDRSNHGYILLDPCDSKIWDIGYLTGPKKEVDFLPTCSMIEEVFGEEAWSNKSSDAKGIY